MPAALLLRQEAFYAANRIELLGWTRAARAVDRQARRVRLASGRELAYDHLVLATGARTAPLPVPGAELDGVSAAHTSPRPTRCARRLAEARDVVVIGAGFIGLEFAAVRDQAGRRVHVVEMAQRPMARAVSPEIVGVLPPRCTRGPARASCSAPRSRGSPARQGRVPAVETGDGLRLPADLVVVGIGVVPNAELAAQAGLPVDDGIVVDEPPPHRRSRDLGDRRLRRLPEPLRPAARGAAGVGAERGRPGACVAAAARRPRRAPTRPCRGSGATRATSQAADRRADRRPRHGRRPRRHGRRPLLGLLLQGRPAARHRIRSTVPATTWWGGGCWPGTRISPEQAADEGFDLKAHAAAVQAKGRFRHSSGRESYWARRENRAVGMIGGTAAWHRNRLGASWPRRSGVPRSPAGSRPPTTPASARSGTWPASARGGGDCPASAPPRGRRGALTALPEPAAEPGKARIPLGRPHRTPGADHPHGCATAVQ